MATYSLSEIDALTRKATRGAGYSWGIAEEVGKAMRWLSAYGFAGPELLADHLEIVADKQKIFIPKTNSSMDKNEFTGNDEPICSLYCGTLINDLGHHLNGNNTLTFKNVLTPLMALPSAARVAEAFNISVSFYINQTEIICNPDGIVLKDTPPLITCFTRPTGSRCTPTLSSQGSAETFAVDANFNIVCQRSEGGFKNSHFPSPQGREIAVETLAILEKYAHKTYAPATEESRLRGAG